MATSFKRPLCALLHSVPQPCSRPPLTRPSAGVSWTLTASLSQCLVGSLLLSPGSWHAQVSVCACRCPVGTSQIHFICYIIELVCAQPFPTLCDPMDYSPPGFSVHGISQQEYCSELLFPPPGTLLDSGIKPISPAPLALVVRFFTTEPPGKSHVTLSHYQNNPVRDMLSLFPFTEGIEANGVQRT